MRDELIDWVIRQCGLDPDNEPDDRWVERRLRNALKPVQKLWNNIKEWLEVLIYLAVFGGMIFWMVDCVQDANAEDKIQRAENREKINEDKVFKCKVWADMHGIDAQWRRSMQLCMGKKEDGSLFTINLKGGFITKLKGRD